MVLLAPETIHENQYFREIRGQNRGHKHEKEDKMKQFNKKYGLTKRLNFLTKAEKIQQIVSEHYEPENLSKCKLQAYRHHVSKIYPMCERQFWRYVNVDVEKERAKLAELE